MKHLLPVLSLFLAAPAAAEINPGEWEIKVTTVLPGAPPAEQALTRCLSAEDGRNPGRLFGAPGPGCEFLNQRDDGKTYRFDILCRDQNLTVSGSGDMSYAPERIEGSLTVRTVAGAQTLDVRSRIAARRLGPCK
ncbi:MAG: DUF3617 domain-containing protein [Betaproteobacteria bacterium]